MAGAAGRRRRRGNLRADRPGTRAAHHQAEAPAVHRHALRPAALPGHLALHHRRRDQPPQRLHRPQLPRQGQALLVAPALPRRAAPGPHATADPRRHCGPRGGPAQLHGMGPLPDGRRAQRAGGALQRHQDRHRHDRRIRAVLDAGRVRGRAVRGRAQLDPARRPRRVLRSLRDRGGGPGRVQPARGRGVDPRRRDRRHAAARAAQRDRRAGHPHAHRVRHHRLRDPDRRHRRRAGQARRRPPPPPARPSRRRARDGQAIPSISQPLRYSRRRNLFAAVELVTRIAFSSHSIFVPARYATHPSSTVSASAPL